MFTVSSRLSCGIRWINNSESRVLILPLDFYFENFPKRPKEDQCMKIGPNVNDFFRTYCSYWHGFVTTSPKVIKAHS